MQRADRNIGELLTDLSARFHRTRQSGIDEELFDVIAGFDALAAQAVRKGCPGMFGHAQMAGPCGATFAHPLPAVRACQYPILLSTTRSSGIWR